MDYLKKRAAEENIEDYLEKAFKVLETTDAGQNDGLPNSDSNGINSDSER